MDSRRLPGKVVTDRPLLLGLARAAMVADCDSEYGALIDADDVNHPDRLEKQMQFMQENPDVAVVGTQINRLNSAGDDLGPYSDYPLAHEQIVQEMLITNPIAQPSVLFRRSAVMAVGNYRDFSPTHVEDLDLWLRLAAKGYRLANLPQRLVDYRVHENSTTQKSMAARRLEDEVTRRLSEAAPQVYGCDAGTMTKLRDQSHSHAIKPLRQIARHLKAARNPWKSPIFYRAARSMIADRDVRSRVASAMENRGAIGAFAEVKAIALQLARSARQRLAKKV